MTIFCLPSNEGKPDRRRQRAGRKINEARERAARRYSALVVDHIRVESRGTAVDPRDVALGRDPIGEAKK